MTLATLVGVALFALLGRSAQSQTQSPALSARMNVVAQAGTSRIAFTSNPLPPPPIGPGQGDQINELYVVNADGSGKRLVVRSRGYAGGGPWLAPRWSPNRQTIAFPGPGGVHFVNADGSGQRNVTREWGLDTLPVWSPDGRKIAFVRGRDADIYVMNADGSGVRRLTRNVRVWDLFPVWSPNSRRIAFLRVQFRRKGNNAGDTTEVWVMNSDGSAQRRVASGMPWAWSPDGQQIAFTGGPGNKSGLYVMNADGSRRRRLTAGGSATWSPDGQKILFVRARPGTRSKVNDVYVMNADGSGQRRLAERGHNAHWSPDGTTISFVSNRDGDHEIYVMDADGTGQLNVSQNPLGDEQGHVWAP